MVIATGGVSYPKTGATGDGYGMAKQFGHALVAPVPHLAPLRIDVPWVHALSGITVDVGLCLCAPDGRRLAGRRRPMLFTHKGLSGPAPMDLAGFVEECPGSCRLLIDFAPDLPRQQLEQEILRAARQGGRPQVFQLLPPVLPERLRRTLMQQSGAGGTLAALSKAARRAVVAAVKEMALPVEQSLGFAAAEVTRGGVPLDEVDARTMQSKKRSGLFFCGEVLDVDGPIGGFNFQAAFATGRLAGRHA